MIGHYRLGETNASECVLDVWEATIVHVRNLVIETEPKPIDSWLATTAHNRAKRVYREARRDRARRLSLKHIAILVGREPDPAIDLEDADEIQKYLGVLGRAVSTLEQRVSAKSFEVFRRRHFEGHSVNDVATLQNLTEVNVRIIDHRVVDKLRALFRNLVATGS